MSVIKFLVEFVRCLAEILLSRPGDYDEAEDDHLTAAQRAALARVKGGEA